MIEPKELRKGNFVFDENNNVRDVWGIGYENHIIYVTSLKNKVLCERKDVSDLSPIPLTPEILENFGFKCDIENNIFSYPGDGQLDFYFNEDKTLCPVEYYTSQPFSVNAYPKYLHLLQNVIFFLTDKELKKVK